MLWKQIRMIFSNVLQIVAAADALLLFEGLSIRVATIPHLIATKVLSRNDNQRPQDRMDLIALLGDATEEDLVAAREALQLIQVRGFNRGKDLLAELADLLSAISPDSQSE